MPIAWLALLVFGSIFGLWLAMATDGAERGGSDVPDRRKLVRRAAPVGLAAAVLLGSFGACGSDESNSTSDGEAELDGGEGADDRGSGSGAPRNADEADDEPAADSNGTSAPEPASGGG